MFGMHPIVSMIVGLVLAAFGLFGGYMATASFNMIVASRTEPKLSFQKLSIFCIELEKDIYQFAAVVQLFNLDSRPYLIEKLSVFRTDMQLVPRGGYLIKSWIQNDPQVEIIENNFIKPNNEGFYKILLPTKLEMTIQGRPPLLLFFGDWQAKLKEFNTTIKPDYVGSYDRVISLGEWNGILKSGSNINLDSIDFMRMPERIAKPGPPQYFLIYNRDRSARFNVYGFGAFPAIAGDAGVMTFIAGTEPPPLRDGWIVLGRTYGEVWSDPQKLALYNNLYPPGPDGKPRMFGVFAGAEATMLGDGTP